MNTPPSQQLINEILRATEKIQQEFPVQYRYLGETPLFLFGHDNGISRLDFEHYLESLLMLLETLRAYPKTPSGHKKRLL